MKPDIPKTFLVTAIVFFAVYGCQQLPGKMSSSQVTQCEEEQQVTTYHKNTCATQKQDTVIAHQTNKSVGCIDSSRFAGTPVISKCVGTTTVDTIAFDNVLLVIDSGAVCTDVDISIIAIAEEYTGTIPENMENLTAGGLVYRMLPDGQKFDKNITIAMRYDSTSLPYGFTPDDIYTFFYNEHTHMWQQIERDSVDKRNHIIYSHTNHFTDYINGVLRVPENSDAMAYTPTSIKGLKAADPMGGITMIAPPEANNMGTANLTYQLTIPAGRRGMHPQLAVTYNSAGGSGILGLGWSLPISEISVETRWGVPLFCKDRQTENYLLDGTSLVTSYTDSLGNFRLNKPVYHRKYEQRDTSGNTRFYPIVEGTFRKIERIGTSPNNYYWTVTDKDGTQHYYGCRDSSRLCDYEGNIAKWLLEKSVDTYGNTIKYKYSAMYTQLHGGVSGKQILIDSIIYTGNDNKRECGKYKIAFKYSEKRDSTNSFRYGREESDKYVIDRIRILYENTIIREYYFGYKSGDFGKTLLCNIIESYEDSAKYQTYPTPLGDSNILYMDPYDRCEVNIDEFSPYLHFTHTFDYYELGSDTVFAPPQELYDSISDSVILFNNPFNGVSLLERIIERGKIGISTSSGWNVEGGFNVGVDHKLWSKCRSAGGHYSYSRDNAHSIVLLTDVNGDGYPDKLYKTLNGKIMCRTQNPLAHNFEVPREIYGIRDFQSSSSSTHNWGVEASASVIGAGVSWNDSRNSISTYTSDVNGDGLVDIIENGSVYLNRGNYIFSDVTDNDTIQVGGSCNGNVIVFNGSVDTTIFDDGSYIVEYMDCQQSWKNKTVNEIVIGKDGLTYTEPHSVIVLDTEICTIIKDTFFYTYPRRYEPDIDMIRIWKAPYSGNIRIYGTAKMTDELNAYRAATRTTDGVWISVHKLGDTNLIVSNTIVMNQVLQMDDTIHNINAGDTLIFRMNSINKRLYDEIEWNPTIEYLSATHTNGIAFETGRTAGNGDSIYKFNYSNDFVISGSDPVSVGDTNNYNIIDTFAINCRIVSTDPGLQKVVFSIVGKDIESNKADSIITIVDTLFGMVDTTYVRSVVVPNTKGIILRLAPLYGDQINWAAVTTEAEVVLTGSDSPELMSYIGDSLKQKSYIYHPVAEYIFYDYLIFPAERVALTGHYTTINTRLTTKNNFRYSGTIHCIVKGADSSILHSGEVSVNNNIPSSIAFDTSTLLADTYLVEFHTNDANLTKNIEKIEVNFGDGNWYNAGLYTKYSPDNQKHHGLLYRGWGQFGYKSDDTACQYVKRDKIMPQSYYIDKTSVPEIKDSEITNFNVDNINADSDPEMAFDNNFLNPLADNFFEMFADAIHHRWTSFGNAVTSSKWVMSLSNNDAAAESGDSIVPVDMCQNPLPVVQPCDKIKTVNKLTMSKGFNVTKEMNSNSYGYSRLLGDYMDLNGDRYPDIVSEKEIQYSNAQGGLSKLKKGYAMDGGINRTEYTASGHAYNGTFLNAAYELSSLYKSKKVITSVSGLAKLSGNNSSTNDHNKNTIMDINGDGLPDIVYSDGFVRYNMGYRFTDKCTIATQQPHRSRSDASVVNAGPGSGFNIGNTSITGGLSANRAENYTISALIDINGDGLPDLVNQSGVRFNKGNFLFDTMQYTSTDSMDKSTTTSFCLNISGTYDWPLPVPSIPAKVGVSVGGGGSVAITETSSEFIDMNNDGYVDYVFVENDKIKVCYSRIGKTNLLKSVKNFAYAQYTIDYELSQGSVACPQRHWNMSSLTVYDGYRGDGCNNQYKRFNYTGRKYDRHERDDYGYSSFSTQEYASLSDYNANQVYRTLYQTYMNDSYYHSRLKIRESISTGNESVTTSYDYRDADLTDGHYLGNGVPWCEGDGWPALALEYTTYIEGNGSAINTSRDYAYGAFGNVVLVNEWGNENDSTDDYSVNIEYFLNSVNHIVDKVSGLTIKGYRKRLATYTAEGSLETLVVDNNPSPQSEYRYSYNEYGNISMVETPEKEAVTGNFYRKYYEYDQYTHTLPVRVWNSENHYSETEYDTLWQKPTQTVDICGNLMLYTYDSHGRISTITAPQEIENRLPYTVKYEYWYKNRFITPLFNQIWNLPEGDNPNLDILSQYEKIGNATIGYPYPFWARTDNFDPNHPDNDIQTITFSDGLGRIIQVKKDIELDEREYRSVGGTVHYDGLGRKRKEYILFQENIDIPDSNLNTHVNAMPYTQTSYDYLDRITEIVFADSTTIHNTYSIAPDRNNIDRFLNHVTNQNGYTSYIYTNPNQLNVQLTDALGNTTMFYYDAVGQLVSSVDPEHNITTYGYDYGGHRIDRTHPSSGHTRWEYDAAGNTTRQIQNSGEYIDYEYNYSRLIHINYPDRPWNDVWYEYGAAGSGNEAGRLVRQQDASGVQEFQYDGMGNVRYNRHTYVQPTSTQIMTLETWWEYDSWGRVHKIVYPDLEEVNYHYDLGGNVCQIEGSKPVIGSSLYIKKLQYDRYEQRVYQLDGNDVETFYTYNPLNRQLVSMYNVSPTRGLLQDNHYIYDSLGNITHIDDSGLYTRHQSFNYDSTNRLISSNGTWQNGILSYSSNYTYSAAGRMLTKNVTSQRISTTAGSYNMNYQNEYTYPSSGNIFAVESIQDMITGFVNNFEWDSNGNTIRVEGYDPYYERRMCWTEDNRLQGYVEYTDENGDIAAYYNYTASGERNYKLTSPRLNLQQNALDPMSPSPPDPPAPYTYALVYPTLYASPLITFNRYGYTKHYFEGSNRICSKIGGGFHNVNTINTSDSVNVLSGSYELMVNNQFEGVLNTFNTCLGIYVDTTVVFDLYDVLMNEYGRKEYEPAFYYHSDHLGSAAYLTNDRGDVSQTLNYLPYGEDWVDVHDINTFDTTRFGMYRFNGKEKDYESGFHYYGARYYWSELLTGWLSVDPMMDKYPSFSPYNYCAWNPVKLVDPNGMDTLFFNQYGKYRETIPSPGKPIGKMKQKDGSYVSFGFADPEHDVESAQKNPDFRVRLVDDETIKTYIKKSRVDEFADLLNDLFLLPSECKIALACDYLVNHSNAGTNPDDAFTLDYTCSLGLSDDVLYVAKVGKEYTGHNGHNFGNFLWGASAKILGVPLLMARIGAHYNNYRSKDEYGGTWDSRDDQRSISLGHKWARRNKL